MASASLSRIIPASCSLFRRTEHFVHSFVTPLYKDKAKKQNSRRRRGADGGRGQTDGSGVERETGIAAIDWGEPRSSIFYEILAHLVEHPEVQNTMAGIVEWWLLEQRIKRQTTKIKTALIELVDMGLVLERRGQDGWVHCRIDQRKAAEIRGVLSERAKSDCC